MAQPDQRKAESRILHGLALFRTEHQLAVHIVPCDLSGLIMHGVIAPSAAEDVANSISDADGQVQEADSDGEQQVRRRGKRNPRG